MSKAPKLVPRCCGLGAALAPADVFWTIEGDEHIIYTHIIECIYI